MRRLAMAAVLAVAVAALGGGADPAYACDCGSTVGPLAGGGGVAGAGVRYIAFPDGGTTLVAAISSDGQAVNWGRLPGRWGIPQVADDGTTGGLSGDGRTLVLAAYSSAFPQRTSRFAVLRAHSVRVERTIRLRGDVTFDAISPDGGMLYLIQHPRPGGQSYRVRAYSVAAGRMLRRPVIDPTRWGTVMSGVALTRVAPADASYDYTLYDRGGGRTFIHALDTVHAKAVCIDLPRVTPATMLTLRLAGDGSRIVVLANGRPFRVVDTNTYAVTAPARPVPAVSAEASRPGGGVSWAWALPAAIALLGAAAALVLRRRGATLTAWRPRSG